MLIGFSTGAMRGSREHWGKALAAARMMSDNAVELYTGMGRLPKLVQYLEEHPNALEAFRFVSVHAPNHVPDGDWEVPMEHLKQIPCDRMVFHPDPTLPLRDLKALRHKVALENLDQNAQLGNSIESLQEWLGLLPQAKLVVDVGHALLQDHSGEYLQDLFKNFGQRISHLHLSKVDASGEHHPVTSEDLPWLALLPPMAYSLPWIWEEVPRF